MNERNYQLLVFDWDGTLMDSEARIVSCLQQAIAEMGAESRAPAELSYVIGLGLREAILRLYPEADQPFISAFADAYREHFLVSDQTPSRLFEGTLATLDKLADQGYLLAVATGKARRGLDRVLGQLGLGERFHATRCADETFSKPHPQMLEEIMIDLDTPPERTLMIGDTEYDMQMALNAGARPLAVSYGVHPVDRLMQSGAIGCIDSIEVLPDWLGVGRPRSSVA